MPLLITKGLGITSFGSDSTLLVTMGLGAPIPALVCNPLSLLFTVNTGTQLQLTFSADLNLSGPAAIASNYLITTAEHHRPVYVNSMSVVGPTLYLNTSPQHGGTLYNLNIPPAGFTDFLYDVFLGPYAVPFTGAGNAPALVMARMINARCVEVIFSEEVNMDDALNAANYIITGTPAVTVTSVQFVTPIIYRLFISHVITNGSYTVRASNIRDSEDNSI